MPRSATARIFLKLNSQFSALNGLALLIAGGLVAPVLTANPVDWATMGLRGLGLGLLGFALVLYLLSKNKFVSRSAVNEIVILDALWVLGSVGLIAFFGDTLTTNGIIVVTIVAMVVAFLAIAQFAAASKIQKPVPIASVETREGKLYATVKRTVKAPKEVVWNVMTDHPAYADVADNISKVEVLSGEGLGMKRRCYGPKGENWEETCDLFEPGHSYGFRIHTDADDYPYPFEELSGRWTVVEHSVGSEFDIEIVATLKGSAASKWLFATMAKPQFKAILIDLADAWADRMEREAK
ncbi:SRPBCC family protein [uncultured Ruegeria sp.]|uniref:SRPBCC family protein n=1 Tax=uncultured Ruegeria sp. TaxID=259304 RepID=UPI00260E7C37|nr:SRPBCC family protein [uncultured Ruegeria sp.]